MNTCISRLSLPGPTPPAHKSEEPAALQSYLISTAQAFEVGVIIIHMHCIVEENKVQRIQMLSHFLGTRLELGPFIPGSGA